MSHSPEPWSIDDNGTIIGSDGSEVCDSVVGWRNGDDHSGMTEENKERIVACVNACAGIPNERMARMDLKAAIECLDNSGGNIDCNDYCGVAHALSRPKEPT